MTHTRTERQGGQTDMHTHGDVICLPDTGLEVRDRTQQGKQSCLRAVYQANESIRSITIKAGSRYDGTGKLLSKTIQ